MYHFEGIQTSYSYLSYIGSPAYRLVKDLARILTPLSGQTMFTVMNSNKFVERLQDIHTTPEDRLVSFDVTSLFTQVPIDEALKVVETRLTKDPTLVDRTSIPVPQLMELIELCLRSTYFQFQDDFFEQIDGTPMGSPLSPVIANLFIENLEELAMHSAPLKPSLWLRYVDNTFVIWPHGEQNLQSFHAYLNQLSTNIQFTIEEEKEGQLAFLDVLVTHNEDRLSTAVYRKPTHTERYILYHSHHHPRMLTGGMRDRAIRICDNTSKQPEMEHLVRVFEANGFPEELVRKTLAKSQGQQEQRQPPEEEGSLRTLHIPMCGASVRRLRSAPLGVKAVFKSQSTLKQMLVKVKQKRPEEEKKEVVYQVPCNDCSKVYIGETKRTLKVRIAEHKQAVKKGDEKNGIAVHAHTTNHSIDWEGARVQGTA